MKFSIWFLLLIIATASAAAQQSPSPQATPIDNSKWMTPLKAAGERMKKADFAGAVVSYTECLNVIKALACYNGRATAHLALKKYALAMTDVNEGLKVSPEASELYSLRATLHRVNKEPLAAIGDLSKAIEYDPETPDYYLFRANIYCGLTYQGVSFTPLAKKDEAKAKELGGVVEKPCK